MADEITRWITVSQWYDTSPHVMPPMPRWCSHLSTSVNKRCHMGLLMKMTLRLRLLIVSRNDGCCIEYGVSCKICPYHPCPQNDQWPWPQHHHTCKSPSPPQKMITSSLAIFIMLLFANACKSNGEKNRDDIANYHTLRTSALMSWMNKPRLTQLPQWHCLGSCPSWPPPCLSFGRLCTPLIPITFVLDQNVHKLSTGWKYPWILPQRRMPIHTLPQGWNELVFVATRHLDWYIRCARWSSIVPRDALHDPSRRVWTSHQIGASLLHSGALQPWLVKHGIVAHFCWKQLFSNVVCTHWRKDNCASLEEETVCGHYFFSRS